MDNSGNLNLVKLVIEQARQLLNSCPTSCERNYEIAGSVMRVRASSSFLLERYLESINHLVCADGDASFTVLLLDSESCGASYPNTGANQNPPELLSSSQSRNSHHLLVSAPDDNGTFYVADLESHIAVCWLRGESFVKDFVPARPLRYPIHWWLSPRRYQLFHGGAVGTDNGAVMLVGPSFSGKSTTCVRLAANGMNYLGDDFVIVGPGTGATSGLSIFNLYSWARIDKVPPELASKPELIDSGAVRDGKISLRLYPAFGGRIKRELPLKAIVCPFIGSQSGRLTPVTKSLAFSRSIPGLGYLPGIEETTIANLASFIAQVPCFSLELGADISEVHSAIVDLILS